MNKLKLGILYKNGKIVNHRSLLKVIINPILRYFGYYIGTICIDDKLGWIKIQKGQKTKSIKYDFKCNEYDTIIKKRTLI